MTFAQPVVSFAAEPIQDISGWGAAPSKADNSGMCPVFLNTHHHAARITLRGRFAFGGDYESQRWLMGVLIQLEPHDKMTPKECLSHCAMDSDNFRDVLVVGFDPEGEIIVRSSHMLPKDAVWLLMAAMDYARGK